jgi:hypothetical protein
MCPKNWQNGHAQLQSERWIAGPAIIARGWGVGSDKVLPTALDKPGAEGSKLRYKATRSEARSVTTSANGPGV